MFNVQLMSVVKSSFIYTINTCYKMNLFNIWALWFFVCSCSCFNFDTKNVKSIVLNSLNDSYFGYSLLLQKGSLPKVIIGAPRGTSQDGGEVFSCSLDGTCFQYQDLVVSKNFTFVGNMMGAVIDGSENVGEGFVACAYKKVFATLINHYLKGYCIYKKDSTHLNTHDLILQPLIRERDTSLFPNKASFYNYAFAQAGFDIQYMKGTNRVLMGAPGIAIWSGGFVDQSLTNANNHVIKPTRQYPTYSEEHSYLGYSVSIAYRNLYMIGAPRANSLLGMVNIYNGDVIAATLTGDEIGAYFGSSVLATDVSNDGVDELFVGAPLGTGSTFDEGYVYYYGRDLKKYSEKLVGSRKQGARFGTTITALGDIDLDSFNDIAVSAPYEDEVGAVYIYLGSKNGIQQSYSQRLTPLDFNGNSIRPLPRGFGLGISKGNDIDGNGHNDLAIGAYKSAQVFIVKGLSIIDYKLILRTNKESIINDFLTVNYCITYTQRSKTQGLNSVDFKTNLQLDYRIEGQRNYEETWQVSLVDGHCKSIDLKIKQSVVDLTPFKIVFNTQVVSNVIGIGENQSEKFVPFVHGCGADNICQTKITLSTHTQTPTVLLGTEQELVVNVIAKNEGETGYQCQLYLDVSPDLSLADKRLCSFENNTFICPFSSALTTDKDAIIKFEANQQMKLTEENLYANFEIKCLGVNLESGKSSIFFNVEVSNSPYIVGKPEKENLFIDSDDAKDQKIVHIFTIGNFGPSPVKLDLTFLMPLSEYGDNDLFEFVQAKGNANGQQLSCHPITSLTIEKGLLNVQSIIRESLNNTFALNCFQDSTRCLQIVCPGDYFLYRSNEIATYQLVTRIKTQALISKYGEEFKKNIMAYITSAFLFNSTARIEGHTATLVYYSGAKIIAMWIYIVALILGIVVLLLLSFLLYKCHFFDRVYRDKMKDEKLMDQPLEIESSDTEKKNYPEDH